MSEHPYRYGPYPGQPPHAQFQSPFTQPPSLNTQPPYYGAYQQPTAAATAGNYATVHNSFQFNASNIPGLGMSSSLPTTPYRSENNGTYQPRSDASRHPLLPIQKPANPPATTSEQTNFYKNSTKQRGALAPPEVREKEMLEEGELSEGEFEDLYEPKDTVDVTVPTPPTLRPPSVMENQNGSVGDADESSIYDGATPQGETAINSTSTSLPAAEREYSPDEDWEPSYQERERSGSYSPYLSPREIQRRASVSKPTTHGERQTTSTQPALQSLPGIHTTAAARPPVDAPLSNGAPAIPTQSPATAATHSFRSVAEAKKKAQEAILGLWPLKVRYQDYIEEGFDEKLIKGLFTDLGLEASIPKAPAVHKAPGNSQVSAKPSDPSQPASETHDAKDQSSSTSKPKQPTMAEPPMDTNNTGGAKATEKTAAEERKDKIARKLAAKAQKTATATATATAPKPSVPTPTSQAAPAHVSIPASATASPAIAKPKTRAENNAILHQKLAALKKAQEKADAERKLQAENSAKPMTPPANIRSNSATLADARKDGDSSTKSPTATLPAPETGRRSVSTEKSLPRDGGIPGLFLTTQPIQPPTRSLKRPVASDFDNYSTPTSTLKRTRTQETLIIDVSDDEDVEMDIASPTDEPTSSNEIINPLSRQPSLKTFPPLSDPLNQKQRSSPASSAAPTPPVHGAKLDLLHKRIEETKRLIAEAEAKKAAKRVNSPQSPQPQPQPQPSATESTASPKAPEAPIVPQVPKEVKTANEVRRERIVSFELPIVDATLKEKRDRLKEAVAQAAQLQLEIQADTIKRDRLTKEVEQLAAETGMQAEVPPDRAGASQPNHVESQSSSEQQDNSGKVEDVVMSEGEDVINHNQPTVFTETTPSLDQSQPNLSIGDKLATTPVRSPQNVTPAYEEPHVEASNGNVSLETTSTDTPADENEANFSTATDASEAQVKKQTQPQLNVPDQLPQVPSPSTQGSYLLQSTPASPMRDTSSGPEVDSPKSFSPQVQDNSFIDEQPSGEVLNEASPPRPADELTVSAPEHPTGEVQNSSSHEHPLLTSEQEEPEQRTQVEDLLSYHSPLGYFRAYRFHPKYFDEVRGGLKSMTYSSKIDPMRPVCPRALAGEQCPNGNACEFQHFEDMVLPDAEIITQLGSADMFTGETRIKFIEGLRKVLNDLKANKVKDFDRITKAIIKHRQEFLEDTSKILPLDAGTT